MGTVLYKLLYNYRKEQDEKYAQVKSRQVKRKPESEPGAGDAAPADASAPAPPAATVKSPKSPGGGIKRMRLVLSRPGGGQVAAALAQPPADASSLVAASQADAPREFDL
jgi:hypothetical protein|eukprot:COSAG02_NODE_1722_length_11193_cov_39.876600_3_plen_110_part_00